MRAWASYCSVVCLLFVIVSPLKAQDDSPPADQQSEEGKSTDTEAGDAVAAPALLIEIADEPVAIDPANFVDPELAELASVEFSDASLTEVAKWIEQQTQMPVILDRRSLEAADILPSEPVTDQLVEEPIYLLLDRLSKIEVAWRIDRDIVYLNAVEEETKSTQQFSVGDLFDIGHDPERLQQTIENCIERDSWVTYGGDGDIVMLGDVMFVRHTQLVRRQVAGLLQALRQHGRRTLVFDPPQHALLRQALDRPISVRFDGLPLVTVVRQLGSIAGARIRLDTRPLESVGVRDRQPIDIHLEEQPLSLVLDLLQQQYELAWHIKNGELVMTAPDAVEKKAAVFDVRDLCRNRNESSALQEAIESQSGQIDWWTSGGTGTIEFPLPGTMVIQQSERVLDEVLQLLENYRSALRASKPRAREDSDPILTRYYRMPSIVAEDLVFALPELLEPGTWKTEAQSDAPGTIRLVSSWPDSPVAPKGKGEPADWASAYSVLVIRQRRSLHDEIPELLRKIELGESEQPGGMGSMGGGGFGGGFFRVEQGAFEK